MIDLKNYLTASGRYPDRENHAELTEEHKKNAEGFLKTVNAFLKELGVENKDVTSGWRPTGVAGSAKKSAHMDGVAIDLMDDKNQTLAKLIESKPELLKKYGLWMEAKEYTVGKYTNWVHLDSRSRSAREIQIFKP